MNGIIHARGVAYEAAIAVTHNMSANTHGASHACQTFDNGRFARAPCHGIAHRHNGRGHARDSLAAAVMKIAQRAIEP